MLPPLQYNYCRTCLGRTSLNILYYTFLCPLGYSYPYMFQSLLTEWAMARFHILGILTRLLWFSVIDLVLCLLAAGTGSTVHRVTWSIVGVAPYKK